MACFEDGGGGNPKQLPVIYMKPDEKWNIYPYRWIFVDGQINKLSIPRNPGSLSQMMIGVSFITSTEKVSQDP